MIQKRATTKKRETVLVVLDGIKMSMNEKGTTALQWALCANIINPNDSVFVLIILNPRDVMASPAVLFCCIGGQQQTLPCKEGEYVKFAHDQISQRRETYLKSLRLHYNRCKSNGVNFEVKVAVGWRPMEIVVEEASKVRATWIVLDRCFSGDHSPVDDYNMALVNDNEDAEVLLNSKQLQPDLAHSKLFVEPILQAKPEILDSRHGKFLEESVPQERQYVREGAYPTRLKETRSSSMSEKPIGEIEIATKLASILVNGCTWSPSGMKDREEDILQEEKEREFYDCEDHFLLDEELEDIFALQQPLSFCCQDIVEMTQGFSPENLISQHEEFEIYDGYCKVLDRHVMVKYFTSESNGVVEAARRVASSMSHKNILRLIGYHESVNGTVLVHNSAAKGTLDQYLHGYGVGKQVSLTVQSRMKIAIEIGRVVRYMHEECPGGPVVHGDLQPHNVFLSHDFSPMLSGFDQAVWLQWVQIGTSCSYKRCCHKDPLNHESLELLKSDVFSFGVLLLRLFCKKLEPMDDKSLINWVRLQRGAFHELLDENLENADPYEIYKVMAVATKCTRTRTFSRPSMTEVVLMLSGEHSSLVGSSPMIDISLRDGKYNLLY